MALSKLPEIKTLRKTLVKWRQEILNYFRTRITNARTEGFNNVHIAKSESIGYTKYLKSVYKEHRDVEKLMQKTLLKAV